MMLSRLRSGQAATWFTFALKRLGEDDLPGTEGGLRMTVALDPTHGEAWCRLALLAYRGGRDGEAVQLLRRGIDADPAAADWMSLEDRLKLSLLLEIEA
jgi:cytochrome c-type biogenesis protein CcmH/NrfG